MLSFDIAQKNGNDKINSSGVFFNPNPLLLPPQKRMW